MSSSSSSLQYAKLISRLLPTLGVQNINGKGTAQQGWDCTRWSSWFRHCATNREVAGSIPDWCHWNLSFFLPRHGPGTNSVSNRNEYKK
jgi:hypothetical protein